MMDAGRAEHAVLDEFSSYPVKEYPASKREEITKIHIYDFDQTLYASPLPNTELYPPSTLRHIMFNVSLLGEGWFANPSILETSLREENSSMPKWNHLTTELVKLSLDEANVLTILLTGRKEEKFRSHIKLAMELFKKQFGLVKGFDVVCLKPSRFETTMSFKTTLIKSFLDYYHNVEEISLYDDRSNHINQFKNFLTEYVEALRPSMIHNVIHVSPISSLLPPEVELRLVMDMIESHNDEAWKLMQSGTNSKHVPQYSLSKSLVDGGFRFDVTTIGQLQHLVVHYMKAYLKTAEIMNDLNWVTPILALNPDNVSAMVSTEFLQSIVPHLPTADIIKIKRGQLALSCKWKVASVWSDLTSGFLGCILSPTDEMGHAYACHNSLSLQIAEISGSKAQFLVSLTTHELPIRYDCDILEPIFVDSVLSVKFQYRLKRSD